ncbi:MAG: hypothetical protein N2Z81_00115 [Hydrogenothermaceae bacterium]|nr:hypothetical protein [Hydrogenothermaceae bacterium]
MRKVVSNTTPLIDELIQKGNYYDKNFIKIILKNAGELNKDED